MEANQTAVPATGKPSFYRRKYLINPEFQWTVIGFFIGLAVVTILVFFWAFHLVFGNFVEQAKGIGLVEGHPLFQMLAEQEKAINLTLLSTAFLMFLFLVIGGIILSHHIAGPIYRLTKQLEKMRDGEDFEDIQFRKKDFFHEVAPLVNELGKKIKALSGSQK